MCWRSVPSHSLVQVLRCWHVLQGKRVHVCGKQGGIQILGKAEAVRFWTPVMDVPVFVQLLLLQSFPLEKVKVPQIQFLDRLLEHPVVLQRRVRTVQIVQKTGDSTEPFLVLDVPENMQRHAPAVLRVRHPGASDSVHRQSAGHFSFATKTGAHSSRLCWGP